MTITDEQVEAATSALANLLGLKPEVCIGIARVALEAALSIPVTVDAELVDRALEEAFYLDANSGNGPLSTPTTLRDCADALVSLQAQVDALTSPAYLETAIRKVGMVDAEWQTRAEAAEAEATRLRAQVKKMEDALVNAHLQIKYLHEKFGETGSGNAVLTLIRAALTKGGKDG